MGEKGNTTETGATSIVGALIRGALNTAPFTGGIASLWSDWDTNRRFKRVERTIRELGEELLQSKTFDPSKLGDAEMQLLEDGLRRAAREHREEKRAMFARLLASNWIHVEMPFDERLLFQQALDAFTRVHLRLLHILREAYEGGQEVVHSVELCTRAFGPGADSQTKYGVFVPALNKLSAEYGFVRRRGDGDGKIMIGIEPEGLIFHLNCLLSPIGNRFWEFLNFGANGKVAQGLR